MARIRLETQFRRIYDMVIFPREWEKYGKGLFVGLPIAKIHEELRKLGINMLSLRIRSYS